jgi:hypothetical protein
MAEQGCKLFVYGVDKNTTNQELQVVYCLNISPY